MAASAEYSKAQSERLRAAWLRRRENGTDKCGGKHPNWAPGLCRKCAGPKGVTPYARRSWYCEPCWTERVMEYRMARSKCGACDAERYCLACKRISRERLIAAANSRKTRRGVPYNTPDGAEKYWQNRSHGAVQWAVKNGFLPNLKLAHYACADCGGTAVEFDHRDYGRPLDVDPVCRSCNCQRGTAIWPKPKDFAELRIFGPVPASNDVAERAA